MAMLDELISEADQKFGLLDAHSQSLISLLLSLITDTKTGGPAGFVERMKKNGLGAVLERIFGGKGTEPLTRDQVEKAIGGKNALRQMATRVGEDENAVATTAGFLLPRILGALAPGGKILAEVPDELREFIREHPVALAETAPRAEAEPVEGRGATYEARRAVIEPRREAYEAPRGEAYEAPRREVYEAPRREVHETPRREVYEIPRREVYETPRRETREAPQRETVEERWPRRTIQTGEDSTWLWWLLPLIGLAILGLYALRSFAPVAEVPVASQPPAYEAPVVPREPRVEPSPRAAAPERRAEPVTPPTIVEERPAPVVPAVTPRLVVDPRTADDRVHVSGVVADETTRQSILSALTTAFGEDKVTSDIRIDPRAPAVNWTGKILEIAKLLQAHPSSSFTLDGNRVTLGGAVPSLEKGALLDAIRSVLGSDFSFQ